MIMASILQPCFYHVPTQTNHPVVIFHLDVLVCYTTPKAHVLPTVKQTSPRVLSVVCSVFVFSSVK